MPVNYIVLFSVVALIVLILLRKKRALLYRRLARKCEQLSSETLPGDVPFQSRPLPRFDTRLAVVADALPPSTFAIVASEANGLAHPERSYIPRHKKGGTVAYETMFDAAPALVRLYHSAAMQRLVSRIVGVPVQPTPLHDQSSLSVLVYDKPGDHIGWHFDHNFYVGRHFTVLLAVVNQGNADGGLSHASLSALIDGRETRIATPPNTLVVFEGACVEHKVAPVMEGERRLVLSMTYCTDGRANLLQGIGRRIKDVAFFGPRALWT